MITHMMKYLSLLLLIALLFIFGVIAYTWHDARDSPVIMPAESTAPEIIRTGDGQEGRRGDMRSRK